MHWKIGPHGPYLEDTQSRQQLDDVRHAAQKFLHMQRALNGKRDDEVLFELDGIAFTVHDMRAFLRALRS